MYVVVVIFWQDNIEWYNSCSKENINRHNYFYDRAYRTVHSKCSVWNAVTFDILIQISCIKCHSASYFFPLVDDNIIAAQNTISKKSSSTYMYSRNFSDKGLVHLVENRF